MLKRWRSLALSVLLPCCMCLMLFLDTLYVEAATSWDGLVESTELITTTVTSTISFRYVPELTSLDITGGTYSGSSSGTYSGSSSGTYSGEDTPSTYSSYAPLSGVSGTGTYNGSYSGTVSSIGTESGAESGTISVNVRGTVVENHVDYDSSGDISTSDSGSVSTNNSGTISLTSSSNGAVIMHFHIPTEIYFTSTSELISNKYYLFRPYISNYSLSGNGSVSNVYLSDADGTLLHLFGKTTNGNYYLGTQLLTKTNKKYGYMGFIDFDYYQNNVTSAGSGSLTVELSANLRAVKDEYQDRVGANITSDPVAHDLQQSTLESSQAIEESVTSDTGTGLLATIKNFFGSFFSNIINSFISLFVPSSDYFSTWFDNLNDLLSEKLGMLYAPFDFIISILNSVYSADTSEPSIPFPAITWDGTTLVSAQNLKFSELLGDNYSTLQGYVYFGTDTVLLFAFLYLLQRKIALILTGSEANG